MVGLPFVNPSTRTGYITEKKEKRRGVFLSLVFSVGFHPVTVPVHEFESFKETP